MNFQKRKLEEENKSVPVTNDRDKRNNITISQVQVLDSSEQALNAIFRNHVISLLEGFDGVKTLPNGADFEDTCLEHRLDQRLTSYVPNETDNIKLMVGVSGAGKTRTLLELLYSNHGYYFTMKSNGIGSRDLATCYEYCVSRLILALSITHAHYK